jgi:hypothetical protein
LAEDVAMGSYLVGGIQTMNVYIPSTEDIHQVAYLTLHGWELSGLQWRKKGFARKVQKDHPCGCCSFEEETEDFDTDDAYWEQRDSDG